MFQPSNTICNARREATKHCIYLQATSDAFQWNIPLEPPQTATLADTLRLKVLNIADVAATAQPLFSEAAKRRKLRWVMIPRTPYFEEVEAAFVVSSAFSTACMRAFRNRE
jgi:hypothetical protein